MNQTTSPGVVLRWVTPVISSKIGLDDVAFPTHTSPSPVLLRAIASSLFLVLVIGMMYSAQVEYLVSVRGLSFTMGAALLCIELLDRGFAPKVLILGAAAAGVYTVGAVFVGVTLGSGLDDPDISMNIQKVALIAPLFLALGTLAVGSRFVVDYGRVILIVALVTSVFLVVETLAGDSLLGRTDIPSFQRDGGVEPGLRAVLGAVNPLVLAVQLVVAVPLVYRFRLHWRAAATAVVLAGVAATGSRGPLLIAIGLALVQLIPGAVALVRRLRGVWIALVAAGIALLGWLSAVVWSSTIPGGEDPVDYSTWYRPAMYSFIPEMLYSAPFGVLMGSLPEGVWIMESDLRGPVDLVHTVDSEIVHSVLQFGWLGLVLSVAAIFVSVAVVKKSYVYGAAAASMSLSGIFVALHAWDSLAPLWFMLLGACIYIVSAEVLGKDSKGTSSDL